MKISNYIKYEKEILPVCPDPKALLNEPILTSPSFRSVTTSWSTGIGCLYTWKVCCPLWLLSLVTTNTSSNRKTCSFCKNKYKEYINLLFQKMLFQIEKQTYSQKLIIITEP